MSGFGKSTIRNNPVTDKLRSGQPSVGTWLSLCSPVAAEMMAHVGWDWMVVDVEHSPVGFDTMVNCFRAMQLGGAIPMARVPWNNTIWIQRTLDAGALGLVVPMVRAQQPVPLGHMARQRFVASLARGSLEADAAGRVYGDRLRSELDAKAGGQAAAVIVPAAGLGVQLMVDMHRKERRVYDQES